MTDCIHCGHSSDEPFRFCPMCGAEAPKPAQAEPTLEGRTLNGKYRVLEEIGAGGMGTVFRGKHLGLDKSVALKVLHRDLQVNDETIRRFQGEGIAAGKFSHANVIQIFDFDQDDGLTYLAMEFVEGKNLREYLAERGRVEPQVAVDIMSQILRALAEAHRHGIVHRDLKPDNIMVCDSPSELQVKVLDFGLSKLVDRPAGSSLLTQVGRVLGTPHYMAPEQWRSGDVDHRIDIWAAGAILFELLTGRKPFGGETIEETLLRSTTYPTPSISALYPELKIPDDLDHIVAGALERDREGRYANAEAMLAEFEELRFDGSSKRGPRRVRAKGASRTARSGSASAPRNKGLLLADAGAGVVGLSIALWLLFGGGASTSQTPRIRARVASSLSADERIYLTRLDDAKQSIASGDFEAASKDLDRAHAYAFAGPEAFFLRAKVYRAKRDLDAARADLVEALELDTDDADAAADLAWIDLDSGEREAALSGFERALARDAEQPVALAGKAAILVARGELAQAKTLLLRAVRADRGSALPHLGLGSLLLAEDDADGARDAFVNAKRRAKRDVRGYTGLAAAYLALERKQEAEAQWREALEIDGENDEVRQMLATVLLDAKRAEDALPILAPACARKPAAHELRTLQAVAHLANGARQEAIRALEACSSVPSVDGRAEALLGSLYLAAERNTDAVRSCQAALNIDGGRKETRAQLAVALLRLEQYDAATKVLDAILQRDDSDHFALFQMAVLHKDYLSDRDKARSYLRRYIEAGGDSARIETLRTSLGV